LLESARVAHLGIVDDDGYPRVLPVTFALTERYEQYRAHAPAGPVIQLAPDRFVWWRP
jgi:nitroimidazol reductase NimA-like FMN-containing flavoprotein (pyridoxamine 5'-phosphate oxidase superfamily)